LAPSRGVPTGPDRRTLRHPFHHAKHGCVREPDSGYGHVAPGPAGHAVSHRRNASSRLALSIDRAIHRALFSRFTTLLRVPRRPSRSPVPFLFCHRVRRVSADSALVRIREPLVRNHQDDNDCLKRVHDARLGLALSCSGTGASIQLPPIQLGCSTSARRVVGSLPDAWGSGRHHDSQPTCTQVAHGNAHDVEPVAVLDVGHLTRFGHHHVHHSIQEDPVRQVHTVER